MLGAFCIDELPPLQYNGEASACLVLGDAVC